MSRTPTGRIRDDDGRLALVVARSFPAPVEDVWAAVTEPARLARWIGTYTGDPASGRVAFVMSAEGEVQPEDVEVVRCEPPHVLEVVQHTEAGGWRLLLELAEEAGTTTLTFTHLDVDAIQVESVGPGWEYYLDRLVAAATGGQVEAVDFDRDYYPAMQEHYRAAAPS